jgi:hypothetical protein
VEQQTIQTFNFEINKFNTVSGDISVRAYTLKDAEKLLDKIGILSFVSYSGSISVNQPLRII